MQIVGKTVFTTFMVCVVSCTGEIGGAGLWNGPTTNNETTGSVRVNDEPKAIELADFTSSKTCSGCHSTQADQWQLSSHSRAMTDPVFQALTARAEQEKPGTREYCIECHSNIGTETEQIGAAFSFDTSEPLVMEGVTCESCHRLSQAEGQWDSEFALDPLGPMQGGVYAEDTSLVHDTEKSAGIGSASLCGSCHDVELPNGVLLEQPFTEWSNSPARDAGEMCVDCHMPPRGFGRVATSYVDLPERLLRSHVFLGPGILTAANELEEAQRQELVAEVEAHLRKSVEVRVQASSEVVAGEEASLNLLLISHVSGHRFPTGSVFFRQVWVQLQIVDAEDRVILELQEPKDLLDPVHPDYAQLLLSARLLDEHNEPTLFPWRAAQIDNTNALYPLDERPVEILYRVPRDAQGPLTVRASLQFRTYSPELLDELELPDNEYALTVELGEDVQQIDVTRE